MRAIWPETIGKKYARLLVVRSVKIDGATKLECQCDCGNTSIASASMLISGRHKSCGCGIALSNISRTTHGHTKRTGKSREYACWQAMKSRCYNSKLAYFEYYGARGIKICDRWLNSFEDFYADMGPRPSSRHSIDRRDNDGNYEPGNCHWAVKKQQMRNRRNTTMIEVNGENIPMRDAADRAGLPYSTVRFRMKKGLPEHLLLIPKKSR